MTIGQEIADWLTAYINPNAVYDHRYMSYLSQIGIAYDPESRMISLPTGEMAEVVSYTPAELVKHPRLQFQNVEDEDTRWVVGYELAYFIHQLVWPAEMPPGQLNLTMKPNVSFTRNVESIRQRDTKPYRDDPPSGWWQPPKAKTWKPTGRRT